MSPGADPPPLRGFTQTGGDGRVDMRANLREGVFQSPRGRAVTLTYREDTNDWNTLNACMSEDEYELRNRHFTGWALDIGGYLGGVGIGLALDNPDLRVIIVEPVPQNAALIRKNIASAGVSGRVTLVEGAVGYEDEPVAVWYGYRGTEAAEHHAWVGNSSIAYDHGGEITHDETIYETPLTLGQLIGMTGSDRVALCKVDIEGGEYAFLDSRDTEYVDLFVGEWHPVRGHRQADIDALIGLTHDVTFSGPVEGPGGFVAVRS